MLLRQYPQMRSEGRIYHVGLDIIVPEGWSLFAPLDAVVHAVGKENGLGNYGGYVILKHSFDATCFYSMYGHLQAMHCVKEGQVIHAGERLGSIGGGDDSGGWFTHTHLQIITAAAGEAGRFFHGYVSAAELQDIENIFPSPYPLFRY